MDFCVNKFRGHFLLRKSVVWNNRPQIIRKQVICRITCQNCAYGARSAHCYCESSCPARSRYRRCFARHRVSCDMPAGVRIDSMRPAALHNSGNSDPTRVRDPRSREAYFSYKCGVRACSLRNGLGGSSNSPRRHLLIDQVLYLTDLS